MHSIVFKRCSNDWKNALPLGNGVFGAMAFLKNNALSLPMNHYEIYYNISDSVLPKDQLKNMPLSDTPGKEHSSFLDRANRNAPKEGEPYYYYRLDKDVSRRGEVSDFTSSYPSTGELCLRLSEDLKDSESELRLDVEDARVRLKMGTSLKAEVFIAREDLMICDIEGEGPESIGIVYPESRDADHPEISYFEIDPSTFAYKVKIHLGNNKYLHFAGIIRLIGARGRLSGQDIILTEREKSFSIAVGIFTSCRYKDVLEDGLERMPESRADLVPIRRIHKDYWDKFFSRSSVTLPDKFLERVYYVNQYALDCSSGKDGVMKHHACGLNGLWDIRHPNLWGSMWYWDVNIQAAFAGVFSSNRLDLGKVFSDGLLTYTELAERFAKNVHNMKGAAIDYPYSFYYSTWPWCAQYLWAQYEYSLDKEYLREEAYPLFLKLCEFACELFEYDEVRGEYVVYPDISPEQGPLAHNTVITVASVKYMLKFTLQAAKILGDNSEILKRVRVLLEGLPEYATVTDDYGKRFLDSEDAPAKMWIRHPSMLMPIFPTGEIDLTSDAELIDIARNTLTFLEENCEIGVFQVSWLAAVAARLGDGQRALRLLYEMGTDHLLRSNGLAAEENERFMNYCLIARQPFYYPCMMEFTGEMLAAVNEMLMQSNGGIIRLFPAMPDGNPEYDRLLRRGQPLNEYTSRYNSYPAWENASFDRLLARGAFEVSAELCASKITYLKIYSKMGGSVRITSPYPLTSLGDLGGIYDEKTNVLEFDTVAGESYTFGERDCNAVKDFGDEILSHLSYTKRRVFIGEDEDTSYCRALDSFTRDWYLGNVRMENHSVYRFDLGGTEKKDYGAELLHTGYGADTMFMNAMGCRRLDGLEYTVKRGFGFASGDGISCVDRNAPDQLRRDFVEGESDAQFIIDAPRGQYELFIVSGDAEEDSVTVIECDEGRRTKKQITRAGRYQTSLIPVIHENDGRIRINISTEKGYKWKINYIFVNLYKQF